LIKLIGKIESAVKIALIIMMICVILAGTIELGFIIVEELRKPPIMLLNSQEMIRIFGFFLMILIGLELLETVKAYFTEQKIHTSVVFLVALIAIARKVIILDLDKYSGITLLGIAGIIVSLSVGYFLFKKVGGDATGR
jgi:uncharacterized membrane protein (DUF373 family)